MKYQQKCYPFYNPTLVRMTMGNLNFVVNYADMLDQTCVEFEHVHDCYEIYYCMSGIQNMVIDGQKHVLLANTFVMVPPGVYHYTVYEPDQPKQYVIFVFTPPGTTSQTSKKGDINPETEFLSSALKYFENNKLFISKDQYHSDEVISRIEKESAQNNSGKSQMLSALYQEYLICIFRHLVSGKNVETPQKSVNLAIELTKYMHENYFYEISVQDVADAFYMSPRHVNRVFEDYFGQSFKHTLNIYRINYAKNYLIDTDYPASQIAGLVGFSSPKTLYKLFKDYEGISVSQFRAEHRNKQNRADQTARSLS